MTARQAYAESPQRRADWVRYLTAVTIERTTNNEPRNA